MILRGKAPQDRMTAMSETSRPRITEALIQVENAITDPGAYPFLPGIKAALEAMLTGLPLTPRERERLSGALGRLVTEDYRFSESKLGTALLQLADEFTSIATQ
jgi:hypothetical protein